MKTRCVQCGSPRVKQVDLSNIGKFSLPYAYDEKLPVLQCKNPSCIFNWNGVLEK